MGCQLQRNECLLLTKNKTLLENAHEYRHDKKVFFIVTSLAKEQRHCSGLLNSIVTDAVCDPEINSGQAATLRLNVAMKEEL